MKSLQIVFFLCLFTCLTSCPHAKAQKVLKPGFDVEEYADMLGLTPKSPQLFNTDQFSVPYPSRYRHVYRSPAGPLDNLWDLYIRDDNVGVIEIQGNNRQK